MGTTQEAGQHLVLFVAAGDGSESAIDAVARQLAEKFGTPFERMQASVRQSPRVFKRNMSLEQAESCAAMLRSMGAVAEVQTNSPDTKPQPSPEAAAPPQEEAVGPTVKPPPPEAIDLTCPFCGRDLQDGGICVICRPQEVGPVESAAAPEPALTPQSEMPSATIDNNAVRIDLPPVDGVEAGEGLENLDVGSSSVQQVEAGCANCGELLDPVGQCPTCDQGSAPQDESAAIENDLSTLLSPEELGVCPNCCGPMEQDGTCLICPPPDPAQQPTAMAAPPSTSPELPAEIPLEAPPVTASEPAREEEASPFEPLAPLNAEPERDGVNVCSGCGGPKGADGTCLICGDDVAPAIPGDGGMTVTGNQPPAIPVIPTVESAPAAALDTPAVVPNPLGEEAPPATEKKEKARPAKKKDRGFSLDSLPRGLTISLLATLLLLVGGIALAAAGKFIIASGAYFLALIAGLVVVVSAIKHMQHTVASFPKLPKPVIFAFICFLFFAGSSGIIVYALKQSAIFLLDKHGEKLQAELAEQGLLAGDGAENTEGTDTTEGGGQIIMEDEMLDRAITAEAEGEESPRTALETWSAYLEGFPDGSRATEARRRISHWKAVVNRQDALDKVIDRDRKGNNDPSARIRDWKSCLATYGNTPNIRQHAEERINFWESMIQHGTVRTFPYWASLRLDDGREFSGKVVAENDRELKMELPNQLKMSFSKGEFELVDSDHMIGKRVEAETMQLVSGVTTAQPTWGHEDRITILGGDRAGVQAMISFPVTGFYHFEVMARAGKDQSGFPSVLLSLNGAQQERIRFDSEEWKLYEVAFPFRIPAGEHRLEILFPPHYQTMQDKRNVAIDYFTTSMLE